MMLMCKRDYPELLGKIRGYVYIGTAILVVIVYLWRYF
jgi:hypothetical protein